VSGLYNTNNLLIGAALAVAGICSGSFNCDHRHSDTPSMGEVGNMRVFARPTPWNGFKELTKQMRHTQAVSAQQPVLYCFKESAQLFVGDTKKVSTTFGHGAQLHQMENGRWTSLTISRDTRNKLRHSMTQACRSLGGYAGNHVTDIMNTLQL